MIVEAEIGAVGGADAVDHPGLEVGDEQLLVGAVIGDIAERRGGVLPAIELDLGEQARRIAGRGVEPVDRARPAGAPHARQPLLVVGGAVKAEGRRRRQVDVRRAGVVERDAEHLADLACHDRLALRLVDPMLPERRHARRPHVDDAADGAVGIDDRHAAGAGRGAGKSRHIGFAGAKRFLLCKQRLDWQKGRQQQDAPTRHADA